MFDPDLNFLTIRQFNMLIQSIISPIKLNESSTKNYLPLSEDLLKDYSITFHKHFWGKATRNKLFIYRNSIIMFIPLYVLRFTTWHDVRKPLL